MSELNKGIIVETWGKIDVVDEAREGTLANQEREKVKGDVINQLRP